MIFVTGKGRTKTDFYNTYKEIEKINQVFAYDRAGLGQSELMGNERTVDTMAYELNKLLVKEKIKPPYILVGHSLGGYVIRCFTNMCPGKVKGLIFMDAAYENEFVDGWNIRPKKEREDYVKSFRKYLDVPDRTPGHNAESKNCFDINAQHYATDQEIVRKLKLPKTIPITVLKSTQYNTNDPYGKSASEKPFNSMTAGKKKIRIPRLSLLPKAGTSFTWKNPNWW